NLYSSYDCKEGVPLRVQCCNPLFLKYWHRLPLPPQMISSLWNTRTTTATPKYKNYQHRVAWSDSQKVLALALHSSHFFIISTFTVLNSVHHASVSKKIHSDKKKARGLPRNVGQD
ncbi:hypothetical protein S83_025305, partial [Arachis hypogaea]